MLGREVARSGRLGPPDVNARTALAGPAVRPLYPVCRAHLTAMTDDIGIWQHAMGPEPDHRFGYCTDDVARLLVVDVLHARQGLAAVVEPEIRRSLAFLGDAFVVESGRFRNFRRAGGEWLDGGASEDCQARALAGAAAVIAGMPGTEPARRARELLDVALPAVASFESLRPIARGNSAWFNRTLASCG